MTRVILQDLRTAGVCFRGARPWFRRHGLAWSALVDHGIAAERLTETGDATALRVVRIAKEREARNGRQQ